MFCFNCGTNLPDGSAFCTNCGASLAAAPVEQPYQQPSYQKSVQPDQPIQQDYQQAAYQQQAYQQPYQQPYQQQGYQQGYQQPYQGQGYQQPYQGQGYQQPYQGQSYANMGGKSKVAAGLLAIFLGSFGAHKFYLGYTKTAIIMLVITLVGSLIIIGPLAMGIIALIEGILYLTKSDEEFYNIYVAGQKEWF